jgi:hypothetical protein
MADQHPRGLVTVSLLKSYFDERHDHLEMFMPLLLDAIRVFGTDDFSSQQMAAHVQVHVGLSLPVGTMDALLSRARKAGCIERDGGRFFINRERIAAHDLTSAKRETETRERHLAEALVVFANERGVEPPDTTEEALTAIVRFVDRNQVLLLLEDDYDIGQNNTDDLGDRQARLVARFILERCIADADLAADLRMLVEGFVLQNALLLRDFGTLTKDFQSLTVFLDTTFLFGLRGVRGLAEEQSAKEAVQLLQALKARLAIFDSTLNEMRRILLVYEARLGTSSGKATLRPREETRFFLKNKYTPALVREMAVGLEAWFSQLGLATIDMPYHDPKFTLDEQHLSDYLKGPDDPEAPRVRNDVDCIAAILTLRAGRYPRSMDSARAVLATTAGRMVSNSTRWFRDQGQVGIPPAVHLAALTSIAWLKKPAAVVDIKVHELIALCAAALRPSASTWDRFLGYLRTARSEGTLSSDEEVAILASELTDTQLSELSDVSDDPDAATIAEVVARVKTAYGDRTAQIEAATAAKLTEFERLRGEEQSRAVQEAADIRTARAAAEARAQFLQSSLDAQTRVLRARAGRWAASLSWVTYALMAAAILYASWAAGAAPAVKWQQWVLRLGGTLVVLLGIAGTLWGTHLGELRSRVARWVEDRLFKYLTS